MKKKMFTTFSRRILGDKLLFAIIGGLKSNLSYKYKLELESLDLF